MMDDAAKAANDFNARYGRGVLWLLVAIAGAFVVAMLPDLGVDEYVSRWCGAVFKAGSGAWVGYRVSKGICRIDPSQATTDQGAAFLHLARAVIVGATVVSVCLAV